LGGLAPSGLASDRARSPTQKFTRADERSRTSEPGKNTRGNANYSIAHYILVIEMAEVSPDTGQAQRDVVPSPSRASIRLRMPARKVLEDRATTRQMQEMMHAMDTSQASNKISEEIGVVKDLIVALGHQVAHITSELTATRNELTATKNESTYVRQLRLLPLSNISSTGMCLLSNIPIIACFSLSASNRGCTLPVRLIGSQCCACPKIEPINPVYTLIHSSRSISSRPSMMAMSLAGFC
jgi:hypothetical protein